MAVAATVTLGWIACRRTRWRRSTILLETLRVLAVALAAVLLGGPQWVQQYRPESKPVVAVLWDDSASMTTHDVARSGVAATSATSRGEAIERLTLPETWSTIADRAEILIQPFAEAEQLAASDNTVNEISNRHGDPDADDFNEAGTDLASPLVNVANKNKHLLGIILASDGDWNMGAAPVQAASRLRLLGVPVFSFPVGSKTRLPDVELLSFDVPTFAVSGKRVRIPFSIDSSLPRDHGVTVTMKSASGDEVSKDIRIAAMGRTNESIDWLPTELGDETLSLSIPRQADEIRDDNNSSSAPIQIRQERLRVLVIESLPRWEYRYLRNALSRDPGVEVSCLLFHPGLDKRGGGNSDYIKEFPATKEELARYDVIFLGDVGTDEGQLTPEQCDWLAGLVREQASGLVFLPGWLGHQFSLLETELADLIPVLLEEGQPGGWGSRTPQHFELTQTGRRSLLTKLADTQDENLEVWENLPGFQWYAPVLAAKPGTETLAVHQEMSNQYGRLPLLVTRSVGAGKVLFMATDGAWRWRKGVEDLYHYRFWGQVVRWMAYQRNMVQGETMRLYYSPEQPQERQTITFNANVMETSGEPLSGGNVTLMIEPPSGAATSVHFEATGDAWGAFSGRFTPRQAGEHRLTLQCKETGKTLESKIVVQGVALEQVGKPARPDVLEEISRVTRGQTLSLDRVDDCLQLLSAMPDPPPAIRRIPLWSHPLVVGSFILLLGIFWVGRKGVGLI
ncbi:hypothetical protein [Novipirellula aureliae]|nr:hypothetical protein [Novipirellula aureliae]